MFRAACASSASQPWYSALRSPRERSSPLTRAIMSPPLPSNSSGVTTTGPSERREVLPLRRPEPDGHLAPLQIAGGPVVEHGEAADLPLRSDDRGDSSS